MILGFTSARSTIEVPCTVEIEHSFDSLHAYVELEGYEVGPGDEVTVHDPPTEVPFGGKVSCRCTATVVQASWLERQWTRLAGRLELTELYEVGFSSWRRP